MPVPALEPFSKALDERTPRLRASAADGRKIIGYFCTYTPVEIIHAAGFQPVRVMGTAPSIQRADALIPNFICPYLRRSLETALAGEFDFLRGLIQGYTCEATQGLQAIWRENIGGDFFHTMPLPYNDSPESRMFLRAALSELMTGLDAIGHGRTAERLSASLDLYDRIRMSIRQLDQARSQGLSALTAADFLTVIQAGFVLPPEEYEPMLAALVAEKPTDHPSPGPPVLVSGSLVEDPRVLEIIEECGGRVVADDLCTGLRPFSPAAGQGRDPLDRLTDRTLRRWPCPTRARAEERAPWLIAAAERSGARAVIFLVQKFCPAHLADLPPLRNLLKEAGLPSLTLELEETGTNEGQTRTRIESFFETASFRRPVAGR